MALPKYVDEFLSKLERLSKKTSEDEKLELVIIVKEPEVKL